MANDTCVYLHTRIDGVVFYVGIGSLKRSDSVRGRNQHWHNTVQKYGCYSITILYQNLSWDQACALEIELIKKYRELSGDKLCNATEGGDGAKGLKHSPETRAKLSEALKGNTHKLGKKVSLETRTKISESRKGQTPSEETRAKIGAASRNPSLETREKISKARKGRTRSAETRTKISEANRRRSPELRAKVSELNRGKTRSEETRAKMREAKKNISPETRAKLSVVAKKRYAQK